MLTYTLDAQAKIPLYEQLYRAIKTDITKGVLRSQDKLPSTGQIALKKKPSQASRRFHCNGGNQLPAIKGRRLHLQPS